MTKLLKRSAPSLACLIVLVMFGAPASSQVTIGSTAGWTYYGLLKSGGAGGTGEQWTDLDFIIDQTPSGSKIPVKGMQAKCRVAKSIRSGAVSISNGVAQWPSITGLVAAGTSVKITDVMRLASSNGGSEYWVKIENN